MSVYETQTTQGKDALYNLIKQIYSTSGSGTITETRLTLINGVKIRIDEMMPEGEGVQFDLDGEMKLEKIIPVNFQLNGPSITFFPNPVKDILTLRTNGQAFDKATISDLSGKVVGIYKLTGAETSINMVNLSAGLYIIKLTGKAGQIVNRVMKN